jgi:hypothetical protein
VPSQGAQLYSGSSLTQSFREGNWLQICLINNCYSQAQPIPGLPVLAAWLLVVVAVGEAQPGNQVHHKLDP